MTVFSVKSALDHLNKIKPTYPAPEPHPVSVNTAQDTLYRLGVKFKFFINENDAQEAISILANYPGTLGCDLETTPTSNWKDYPDAGLNPYLAEIRVLQFATETEAFVFDMKQLPFSAFEKLWIKPLVFHNATFDVKFLLRAGVRLTRVGCTQSMDLILKGGGKWGNLAGLCKERLQLDLSKEEQLSDWSRNTLSQDQIAYAALDAVAVRLLCNDLLKELRKRDMLHITSIIQKTIPAVAAMELAGIPFDWESHQNLVRRWESEFSTLSHEIQSTLEIEDMSSTRELQLKFEKRFINNSYEVHKGKNGLPKLGKGELARFKDDPLVAKYLEYSCLKSRLSTFGDSLKDRSSPVTDRIHPKFLHGSARTGRFATSNPNTQNFPNGEFRNLIKPRDGRVFVVADYSQIELRLIAIVAGEENMLEAYREGKDLHRLTASKILHIQPNQVTKEQRTCAKAVNFGFIYGQREGGFIQVAKIDYGLEINFEEAKKYRDAFFQAYPAIAKWHQEISRQIQRTGKIRTLNGWERDFNREIEKIFAKNEETYRKKVAQRDARKIKIQNEEEILKRHHERIVKDPDNIRTNEIYQKKETSVAELKYKYRSIERECHLLNGRITNARKERNILMVPKILDEKCNILFAAYNLPIQGLGCELMAVALAKVHQALDGTTASIINCVHDEIVIECDHSVADEVSSSLTQEMRRAFLEMFPNHFDTMAELVETKIAKNWGEAK